LPRRSSVLHSYRVHAATPDGDLVAVSRGGSTGVLTSSLQHRPIDACITVGHHADVEPQFGLPTTVVGRQFVRLADGLGQRLDVVTHVSGAAVGDDLGN